jgi:hypothetical protein
MILTSFLAALALIGMIPAAAGVYCAVRGAVCWIINPDDRSHLSLWGEWAIVFSLAAIVMLLPEWLATR